MKIIYREGYTGKKELNADWFADFNWQNFAFGETVWMEDNEEVDCPAALFLGIQDGAVQLRGVGYRVAYRYSKMN
jgi:hypothetical protein